MDIINELEPLVQIIDDTISSTQLVNRHVALEPREQAVHLVELDNVIKRHYEWMRHFHRVLPFYAIKCNDEPAIVKTLALLGCSFDCSSKKEILQALELGVPSERILFDHPIKSIESLKLACAKSIRTVFDNAAELGKIHRYYPNAEVLLRIRYDSPTAKICLGSKFGCDPETGYQPLLALAEQLNIKVIGFSFHVGSVCTDASIFYEALKIGRKITDYAHSLGFRFSLIDIGGGFPGDKSFTLETYVQPINKALDEFFPAEQGFQVIAEPGRYYSTAAITTVTCIMGKRNIACKSDASKIERVDYYLNDGIFGSFYCAKHRDLPAVPISWNGSRNCGPKYKSTLFGPTCDSADCLVKDFELPMLELWDYLVFENKGAYSIVHATSFNGFPLPNVFIFIRKSMWIFLNAIAKSDNRTPMLLSSPYINEFSAIEQVEIP